MSDILRAMRVQGSVYFCDMLDPPWTQTFEASPSAGFHMIRRGECWATVHGETEYLGPGDLIFLGPQTEHVLSSEPPGRDSQGRGVRTLLLCGYCDFLADIPTPLLSVMPDLTIVRSEELDRHPFLKGTFDQLSAEYMASGPGSELIVNKLTEIVLIELIRINFCREAGSPFLLALNDKSVSRALQFLHEHPERSWTIQDLAQEVGLSRAAFAKRFKALVGETVFQYLTSLRMQRARQLLRDTSLPVYEIGQRVGYESDLAFTKAFKKQSGQTPRQFRLQYQI
ncbi:MAG: AraC family transcriptional regulator [Woeseiaceae bacterium]|nr:AraC family transcriptional regulator [Woeseiaceae bacterium]